MPGLLLINKPSGLTSFGAVAKIKRLTGEKRVGHTGTLDPMATGVLPVFTGRATVLSSYLLSADKSYVATARLGICTDTLDITGNIIRREEAQVTKAQLEAALSRFAGPQMQVPPAYSAIKKQGVRMYELARRGVQVEIEPRAVEIHSIKLLEGPDSENTFTFETSVSKGTYIRSLVRDIGDYLSTGAVLCSLTRTKTAGFSLENCVLLDNLTPQNVGQYLLPPDTAVKHLAAAYVTEKQAVRFSNGGYLDLERVNIPFVSHNDILRVYCGNTFLGLGAADCVNGRLAVKCLV